MKLHIIKKSVVLILLLVLIYVTFQFDLHNLSISEFQNLINGFGVYAAGIFILIYALAPVIFIPASILSLAAGALFGKGLGTLYVLIGANIAANISFFIARYYGKFIQSKIASIKQKHIVNINEQLEKNGFMAVLYLRLIPLLPYALLNYAFGITKVTWKQYFFGTFFGIIPGTFAFVYLGEAVTKVGSNEFWYGIVVFVVFGLAPFAIKKILKYRKDKRAGEK